MLEFDEKPSQIGTNIKIVGVGGAGGNAINTMIANDLFGVEFIAANTDNSDINKSKARMKIQLGKKLTRGLGTGANPESGKLAAEESKDEIRGHLEGSDMIFIAAGMGGGTGTGAAPVIAKIARELGILTLGIVSTPFSNEGKKRKQNAEEGIKNLSEYVDTLIIIPNEKLQEIYSDMSIADAFKKADSVLFEAAKAVSDIINVTGYMNVDFADVKTVMSNMGHAHMGIGTAEGENRAIHAARAAINNPLLSNVNLVGCQSLLINITAGPDMKMSEFNEASSVITSETGSDANIITGLIIDEGMSGKISVTLIATGLSKEQEFGGKVLDFKSERIRNYDVNTNPLDDFEDVLGRLNHHKQGETIDSLEKKEEEPKTTFSRLQGDMPAFLKALD